MSRLSPDDVILGLLAAHPGHGYQLLEHFRAPQQLGQVWHLSTSQLYAILKRLECAELVVGQERESQDAPTRTEYRLTETGNQRLLDWLHEQNPSASTRRIRTEFLSRLYVAHRLSIPAGPIIHRQKSACQERQMLLLTMRDQTEAGIGYLSLDLLISEMRAILQWIDRCETLLVQSAGKGDNPG